MPKNVSKRIWLNPKAGLSSAAFHVDTYTSDPTPWGGVDITGGGSSCCYLNVVEARRLIAFLNDFVGTYEATAAALAAEKDAAADAAAAA